MSDNLDFLDAAPPTPTVTEPNVPATTDVVKAEANVSTDAPALETVESKPEDRVKDAQKVVDAANANLKDAQSLLQKAIKDAEKADAEIPLHVRNAHSKMLDQQNRDRHNEALKKVAVAGVDVKRLVSDLGRPRPRKIVPPVFKP